MAFSKLVKFLNNNMNLIDSNILKESIKILKVD
jgi:hypothetical protein